MFNVCENCGAYHGDKEIDPMASVAVCPDCEHRHPFVRLPLFCLTGASGTGKTTLCLLIMRQTQDVVVMESDILWRKEFDSPETQRREYRNLWLRVCKNISQAGRPVLLCGSVSPGEFEPCEEFRYFSAIHYLALVCDDSVLSARLRSRPGWRKSSSEEFVSRHLQWNRWFQKTKHEHEVSLLDTTGLSPQEAAARVRHWISERTGGSQPADAGDS